MLDDVPVDVSWSQAVLAMLLRLGTASDPKEICVRVEALLLDHMADDARCLFYDEEEGLLWSARDASMEDAAAASLSGQVAAHGELRCVEEARRLDGYNPRMDGQGERFLAVPIQAKGPPVHGVLWVSRGFGEPPFAASDVSQLQLLVRFLAPRLDELTWRSDFDVNQAVSPLFIEGPYRSEALQELMHRRERGALLHFDRGLLNSVYWAFVGVTVLALFGIVTVPIGDDVQGPSVVRLAGRSEVVALRDGAIADIAVQPGEAVVTGQILVTLHDAAAAAEFRRLELEFEEQLRHLLRNPDDPVSRQAVTTLRGQRLESQTRLREHQVRSPADGVVQDLWVTIGHTVGRGDLLVSLAGEEPHPQVWAILPGEARPRIRPGTTLVFRLDGYRDATQHLSIDEVSSHVVRPIEVQRRLGIPPEMLPRRPATLVRARLADAFASAGHEYPFHDGMTGTAEVRIRSTTLLFAVFPSLEAWF
ncbi:MAG: HlyD family efflux transporter periplasmic adaptor subunit [Myxococcota bacterium]